MNLTGVPISAQEASDWGLVARIFPPGRVTNFIVN